MSILLGFLIFLGQDIKTNKFEDEAGVTETFVIYMKIDHSFQGEIEATSEKNNQS